VSRGALHSADSGFTLIELLVGLSVTMISLLGLLSLYTTTARGNRIATEQAEAADVGTRAIEELRRRSVDDIVADLGALPIDADLDTVSGSAGLSLDRHLTVEEVPGSTGLVKLRVEVQWTDGGATRGAEGGIHDHSMAFELVVTREEAL
jgi:hypothetical protein